MNHEVGVLAGTTGCTGPERSGSLDLMLIQQMTLHPAPWEGASPHRTNTLLQSRPY